MLDMPPDDTSPTGQPATAARGTKAATKQSYTIPCAGDFRDAVLALAERRGVNVADLARSVALLVPAETLAAFPDPGEPDADDRETVIIKSGPSAGRPWRRKPRLQVRMAPGFDAASLRRALGVALAMDKGEVTVMLEAPRHGLEAPRNTDELDRLKAMVAALAFDPLAGGVTTRAEALFVLGFPPGARPDTKTINARFRLLATIHHPDGAQGSHDRMSQLNSAMEVLRDTGALAQFG